MRRALVLSLAVTAFGVTVSTQALAGNEAAAEALFVEAKKLAAQGKYAQACPKFAESNRLDRGAGTLIHLGDCYEKNKQSASAWATYKEAASAAQALNRRDWEKLATQRANALEPKLAKLTIKVEDETAEKLEVRRDGELVARASWGVPIPIDAGTHEVEAGGTNGYKLWKTTSTAKKDGESVEVVIPKLEQEKVAPPPPPPQVQVQTEPAKTSPVGADAKKGGGSQKTLGFAVAGVGLAGIAVGAVTGFMAIGKKNDATDVCPNDGTCANRDAVAASDDAKTLGLVSTIGFGVGAAALVTGSILVLTAPSAKKTSAFRLAPAGGASAFGLQALGTF